MNPDPQTQKIINPNPYTEKLINPNPGPNPNP